MRTAIDPNDSEIDVRILNECEHILKANLDRSQVDLSWTDLCINVSPSACLSIYSIVDFNLILKTFCIAWLFEIAPNWL